MTVLTLLAVLAGGPVVEGPTLWRMLASQDHDVPADLPPPVQPAGVETVPPSLTPPAPPAGTTRYEAYQALASLGRADEYDCMDAIFEAESGWNPDGLGDRDRGGSVGLGQRHIPVWGDPRPWTVTQQVAWFTGYADDRYGGWCQARDRWQARSHSTVDGRMVGGWW